MKAVTQEEGMGCGLACVAYILKIPYKKAKPMFKHPENSSTKGFMGYELKEVLNKKGLNYSSLKYKKGKIADGTIVFIERSKKYPYGHFLVKTKKGYMNPWINYPSISPAKSGFEKKLLGKIYWIVCPNA